MDDQPKERQPQDKQSFEQKAEDFGKRAETWGENIDKKAKRFPVPIRALGNSICILVGLFILYWILGWVNVLPDSWEIGWIAWLIAGAVIFVVSLLIGYGRKSKSDRQPL